MQVKVGDKFKVVAPADAPNYWGEKGEQTIIYTVTAVNGRKITWDCIGKTVWYRNVNIGMIEEHVNDLKDLIRI